MYRKGDKTISIEEATSTAEAIGMSIEEWANKYGWAAEGKLNGSAEMTPPTEPEKKAPAGDSSSGDISLESPEPAPIDKALSRLSEISISDEFESISASIDKPERVPMMQELPSGIMAPTGEFFERYAYDSYIKQAEAKLGKEATPEKVTEQAKAMYLNSAKSNLINAKAEEILEDFDNEIYTPLGRLNKYRTQLLYGTDLSEGGRQRKLLEKEVEASKTRAFAEIDRLSNNKAAQETYLETAAAELNTIGAKYKKDPKSVTPEEIKKYKNIEQSYNNVYATYKETNEELANTAETAGTLEELVDLTARSYDNLDIIGGRVASASLNFAGNFLNFAKELSPEMIQARVTGEDTNGYVPMYAPGIMGNVGLLSVASDELVDKANEITGKIEKRQELSKIKSVEDFLEFGLDLFSEQAVNTALTAGVPVAGLGLVAASASGEKFRSMDIEMEDGEKYSPFQFYTSGLLYGAGEYVTEKIALDQFLTAKKALKKSFDLSGTAITQSPTTTISALKTWGTGLNQEGVAELGSQVISNFADKVVLDKGISLWDGVGEAYFSGAVMSGLGFGAPGLISGVYSAAITGNEAAAAGKRSQRVIEITNRINDLQANSDLSDATTQEAVNLLQEEADGLLKENLKSMKAAEARIDELSRSDKRILLNIDSQIWRAKGAADKINSNENLTEAEKKSLILKHSETISKLELRKDDVLANSEASKSRAKARVFQMKTAAEKGLDFNYISGENTEDAVNQAIEAVDNADISDENKESIKKEIQKAVEGEKKGEVEINGFYYGAKEGFPMAITTKQGEQRERSVTAHEVSHATLFRKLAEGNADMIGLAQDLRKYMEKTYGEIAVNKFAKVDKSYGTIEAARGQNQAEVAEELMAAAIELSRRFDLKTSANKTLQGKLLSRWNNMFKGESIPTEIKTGKDVLAAIESFNASFDQGEITGLAKKIFKGEVKGKPAVEAAIKEARANIKLSKDISGAAERAKQVMDKVSSNMEFFDANSPLIARVLPGMIQAQLAKLSNKGLQFDMEEAISDVILRIYSAGDIAKFDGRGNLYGYDNGRIGFRIKDMLKGSEGIVEDFNREDVEDLKGATADVTTIEQIEERTEAERPTYKPLLDSRMATPELIEAMESKIPRIVGTAKSRIDAPVSKNTTVTPFVNEIRLALGKQLDIDLKKAMGGKKDGVLRRWLVSNKKAILENMTTTYLMTAFPAAVQKKVDGVWTSDWKGKKIDRETTSTDQAGRTSGAELVRRLPNASVKIDDKTFLSFILDEKGNPLRGKKESLAKAIAEELSIEIINQEMQDPDSKIRQAFEANQERLGAELADNFVAKLKLDSERGNVKYSISLDVLQNKDFQKDLRSLSKAIVKYGQIEVVSDDFKVLLEHDPRFTKELGEALKIMLTEGTLDGGIGAGFIEQIKSNENIPSDIVDELNRVHFGSSVGKVSQAEFQKLGEPVVNDIIPLFPYKILQKLGPQIFGGTSRYTKMFRDKIEASGAFDSTVPNALNVSLTHKFNSPYTGIFKEVTAILESDLPAIEKIRQFEESEARQKILQANKHNRLLAIYTAKKLASAVQKNSFLGWLNGGENMGVNPSTILRILQAQTNLKDGFRAYGNIEYITFKNGPQKNVKFEHVLDNATLMAELANIMLTESNSAIVDIKIENLFESNNMWAEDSATLDFIDTAGQNNPQRDGRLLMLPKAHLDDVYYIGGATVVKAEPIVRQKVEANKAKASLKIDYEALVRSKNSLKQSTLFSLSTPQAIFMVGGPGAGKSSVIAGLNLVEDGYRLINQDPYLEKYIEEAGLPTDEKTYDKEQRSLRAKLGWKARKAAEEDLANNTAAKESMVVDGTGASYNATTKKMKALEDAGYEVHMIFVNTSKEVAVQRNRMRAERSLADFIVTKTWDNVQESVAKYREDYGGRFYGIEMDNLKFGEELPSSFVESVKNGLNQSKTQYSLSLSEEFNNMVERTKGVDANKVYSAAQARMMGEKKGKYRLFIPASAEDFRGLTSYTFAGKGKQGEADQKFIEDKLITPYTRGVAMIEAVKQQVRREYNALAKANKQYFKMLGKKITNSDYTYDQALRVYMWTQQGIEVPGMSKDDINFLVNEIKQFPGLIDLGNQMQLISRQDTWAEPGEHWLSRTLISDLNGMTEKVGRKKYLQEFIENSEAIFSTENLNKIEAVYGTRHKEAIKDALFAMKNGTNRTSGTDNKQVNAWLNWVNNSTGAIMFLNVRSAVLQTLSATNFINWSDNNPLKAAAAFANQKQYWSDFAMIFNSDKLKQRRSGLQTDVNAAEIANEAEGAKNKAAAVVTYLLKIGFTPTQMADSFAISIGGASFYRNRVKTYLKEGMDQAAAEKQAFEDFSKTADEAQQSSDPYLVSQEQRSVLGRLVLAFQNTPMQYTRLMKKAMKDLANGRGDAKTHISKIIYYGAVQNFIFSALQSALFAVIPGFDDEDESEMTDKEREKLERKNDKRNLRIINSMTDSILKGSGAKGAVLATIKNTITEYFAQKEKGFMADRGAIILQALSLSPPIGSKLRKINSALAGEAFNKDILEARGFSIMEDGRINLSPAYSIIGSAIEGVTNIPFARTVDLINGYSEALDSRNTTWQRIALALGWKTWDVGAKNEEHDLIKTEAKAKRKEEGKVKAKETRKSNAAKKNTDRLEEYYKKYPERRPKGFK